MGKKKKSKKKRVFEGVEQMPLAAISESDMSWNKTGSWRNIRPFYDPKTAPCIAGCPGQVDIQGYIQLMHKGEYENAVRLLWQKNPMPAICGRVCYHPCTEACARGGIEESLNIPAIERFLGDWAIEHGIKETPDAEAKTDANIAVVGGGPGGLSFAYFMAKEGYQVTVFEAKDELGGVLRYGIPEYRLPKDILDKEINRIIDLGITVKTGRDVGHDVPVEELGKHTACFLAMGLQRSRKLGLDDEDAKGVMAGLTFLKGLNMGSPEDLGKRAIVIGGGNTAMDVARSAIRLGTEVEVVYRRTRNEMPAIEDEVEEAIAEGAKFTFLAAPVAVLTKNGRFTGIRAQKMELGEPDDSGRRRPVPVKGSEYEIMADSLLVAAGELSEAETFGNIVKLSNGLIVTDDVGQTSDEHIFAGGDIVTGAATVIEAIARGRKAAKYVHAKLSGVVEEPPNERQVITMSDINAAYFTPTRQVATTHRPLEEMKNRFDEVKQGLEEGEVRQEIDRCMSCGVCNGCDICWMFCPDAAISRENGVYTINYDYCKGCMICAQECPRGVISSEREGT
ncbi:MAG: FAD-dependent oxidoreductase [Candidatus Latescibacterota bacterium]|nr:MAG: FAD-dependent oxidoreductase [Candidatus Latescibacterota bacterium]